MKKCQENQERGCIGGEALLYVYGSGGGSLCISRWSSERKKLFVVVAYFVRFCEIFIICIMKLAAEMAYGSWISGI